jgi:hypothetical protein
MGVPTLWWLASWSCKWLHVGWWWWWWWCEASGCRSGRRRGPELGWGEVSLLLAGLCVHHPGIRIMSLCAHLPFWCFASMIDVDFRNSNVCQWKIMSVSGSVAVLGMRSFWIRVIRYLRFWHQTPRSTRNSTTNSWSSNILRRERTVIYHPLLSAKG